MIQEDSKAAVVRYMRIVRRNPAPQRLQGLGGGDWVSDAFSGF